MKSFSIIHPIQVACYAMSYLLGSDFCFKGCVEKPFMIMFNARNEVTDASLCSL